MWAIYPVSPHLNICVCERRLTIATSSTGDELSGITQHEILRTMSRTPWAHWSCPFKSQEWALYSPPWSRTEGPGWLQPLTRSPGVHRELVLTGKDVISISENAVFSKSVFPFLWSIGLPFSVIFRNETLRWQKQSFSFLNSKQISRQGQMLGTQWPVRRTLCPQGAHR